MNETIKKLLVGGACILMTSPLVAQSTFDLDNVAISTAAGIFFSEGFDTSDSFWANAAFAPLDYLASGGNPDGYVSDLIIADEDTGTIFRGHSGFNSSGGNFAGDWISLGIETLSFDVRHDFSDPLTFFARIATAQNFPAHNALAPTQVPPGQWTTVTLDVTEGSPLLINEGAPAFSYASTFGSVGNIQIGIDIVPEPSGWFLALVVALPVLTGVRRRNLRNGTLQDLR